MAIPHASPNPRRSVAAVTVTVTVRIAAPDAEAYAAALVKATAGAQGSDPPQQINADPVARIIEVTSTQQQEV